MCHAHSFERWNHTCTVIVYQAMTAGHDIDFEQIHPYLHAAADEPEEGDPIDNLEKAGW